MTRSRAAVAVHSTVGPPHSTDRKNKDKNNTPQTFITPDYVVVVLVYNTYQGWPQILYHFSFFLFLFFPSKFHKYFLRLASNTLSLMSFFFYIFPPSKSHNYFLINKIH